MAMAYISKPHWVVCHHCIFQLIWHRELQLTWNTKFQFCWKWMIYGLIRSYLSNLSKKKQSKNVWPLVKKNFLPLWFSFLLSNLILERPFLHFSPNRQWVAYLILCTHKVGTFWTKEFEVQCMPILAPEVWNMCKKILLNHIKYFSCSFYTTLWPQ